MPRRKSIPHEDEIQAARRVFDTIIEQSEAVQKRIMSQIMSKMGKKGGSKGGKMRLVTLTAERRSEIASLAANKRWAKKTKKKAV
jgi:hypothetical protein